MAACENLYGNRKQWNELHAFLVQTHPQYIELYMQNQPNEGEYIRICYIGDIKGWLIKNCPLKWVNKQLDINFSIQALICGKPHHKKMTTNNFNCAKLIWDACFGESEMTKNEIKKEAINLAKYLDRVINGYWCYSGLLGKYSESNQAAIVHLAFIGKLKKHMSIKARVENGEITREMIQGDWDLWN